MPSRRAISCVDTPENFSRIISRASRIPIRSAGIDPPLGLPKGRPDQANGGARQSTNDPGRDHSVMGARSSRNRGAASFRYEGRHHPGIGGRLPQESARFHFRVRRQTRRRDISDASCRQCKKRGRAGPRASLARNREELLSRPNPGAAGARADQGAGRSSCKAIHRNRSRSRTSGNRGPGSERAHHAR